MAPPRPVLSALMGIEVFIKDVLDNATEEDFDGDSEDIRENCMNALDAIQDIRDGAYASPAGRFYSLCVVIEMMNFVTGNIQTTLMESINDARRQAAKDPLPDTDGPGMEIVGQPPVPAVGSKQDILESFQKDGLNRPKGVKTH